MLAEYVITGGPGIVLDYGLAEISKIEEKIYEEISKEKYEISAEIHAEEVDNYTTGR